MNPPWTPRDPDAPSELAIDAYAAGEASAEERAAIEAWCAKDPVFAAVVEARAGGFEGLEGANPQAMRARVLRALEADAPTPARPPRRRFATFWGGVGLAAAVAAAVMVAIAVTPQALEDPGRGGGLRLKGNLGLRVFVSRGGEVSEAFSGDAFAAGERLRFRPDDLDESGHLLVVGVESDGRLFGYAPAGRVRSIASDELESDGSFPGSARLDASQGVEWAWLVWCPEPFALTTLRSNARGELWAPESCRTTGFRLVKP